MDVKSEELDSLRIIASSPKLREFVLA